MQYTPGWYIEPGAGRPGTTLLRLDDEGMVVGHRDY
jgi:hypothetical protein